MAFFNILNNIDTVIQKYNTFLCSAISIKYWFENDTKWHSFNYICFGCPRDQDAL